jgi:hypothetical protein
MDKRLYAIASILLIAAIGYYFIPRCEQPDDMTVAMTQLRCAQGMDVPALRAELCKQQHGVEDCQLEESDREAGGKLFLGRVNECAKAELKSNNKCTDKYEDL